MPLEDALDVWFKATYDVRPLARMYQAVHRHDTAHELQMVLEEAFGVWVCTVVRTCVSITGGSDSRDL